MYNINQISGLRWPSLGVYRLYGRATSDLQKDMPTGISRDCCCQCTCLGGRPLLTHTSAETLNFAKRMHQYQTNTLYNNTREHSTQGHHHTVNTKIRFVILFSAEDGEALFSQPKKKKKKKVLELSVAQIMRSLSQNSVLN